jgi:hypothetical protein
MKHKHRIVPGYEGGEYTEGNVVELTLSQHAMWHFAEWQRKGNWRDWCAWRGLAKLISHQEALETVMKESGLETCKKLHKDRLPDGRSKFATFHAEKRHSIKDDDGKSMWAKQIHEAQRTKDPEGYRLKQSKASQIAHEKNRLPDGRSALGVHAGLKRAKAVKLTNLKTMEVKIYPSCSAACQDLRLSHGNLSGVIKGVRDHTKSWTAEFI